MGFGTQLRILLWKNFTIRKRQKFRLFAEIVFPLALFLILVIVRTRPDLKVNQPECHFDGNAMPSAGTWPFLQSLVCNAENRCYQTVTADEAAGTTATGNPQALNIMITRILTDIGQLADPVLIRNLLRDGQIIFRVLGMIRNGTATGGLNLGNIVTNPTDLRNQIINNNISLSPDVIDQLLNATINPALPTGVLIDFRECRLIQNNGTSGGIPNTNTTAQNLRGLVCDRNLNETIIFPTQSISDTVQTQLCNLTLVQFDQLYGLLLSALNNTRSNEEIIDYIERNGGQELVSDPAELLQLANDFATLYQDYQNDRDVIETVEGLFNQLQGTTMGQTVNGTALVQNLVCGRGATKCRPGYYIAGSSCLPCKIGTYQPNANQGSCIQCEDNLKTNATASTSENDCQVNCGAGQEGDDDCSSCKLGYYKPSAGLYPCMKCPQHRTSNQARTQCNILNCAPGYNINNGQCIQCLKGYYQTGYNMTSCTACPANHDTQNTGSSKSTDCQEICPAGTEGDTCKKCEKDYYKSTAGIQGCMKCSEGFTASDDRSKCIMDCKAGSYIDGNKCSPCGYSTYQPNRGQTSCLSCDSNKNTTFTGSDKKDDCKVYCGPELNVQFYICKRTVCADLIDNLKSNSFGNAIWKQLKPLVEGKIPYAPNTTAINDVIKLANKTFDDLFNIVDLARSWRAESDVLSNFLETNPEIQLLRDFTCSEACDNLWHTLRRTACNGTLPGFNISSLLSGLNVGGFNIGSLIPGLSTGGINDLLSTIPGFNQSGLTALCDVDPNYSPCESLFQFLYSGTDINISNYTWKEALENVNSVLEMVSEYGKCFVFDKFEGFKSEYELTSRALQLIGQNKYFGAIVFDKEHKNGLESHVKYSIRMNQDRVDTTNKIQNRWITTVGDSLRNCLDGLLVYYIFIENNAEKILVISYNLILKSISNQTIASSKCQSQTLIDIYFVILQLVCRGGMPGCCLLAMICKNIVYEKEMRLKEIMKIMGLGNGVHWLAWFIDAFIVMFISLILMVIILKAGKVLEHSDPSVILFLLTAFTVATISQCFLFSVFFSKANIAACVAGFLYFMLYLIYPLCTQWEELMTSTHKSLAGLSSSVAFGFACSYVARYEEQSIGIQWSNIGETPIVDDDYSCLNCIIMMIVDAIIYGLFTWYIEAVFPGQYGIPRKFYFPFLKSYWCGSSISKERSDQYMYQGSTMELKGQGNANVEEEPKNKKVGVSIRNLKKVYKTGNKVAVDGLSINFYEGQISSFLGHNGAGKTTTMSILTGLFPPSDGTAFIYGHNILTEMDAVRDSLGMCPQHNVLFDKLTVEEHLWFYARLKNLEPEKVKREMVRMIQDVGLPHKKKELSSSLSGGMKRKLSVAIAFVGNAKTVILDEPTAGIDPYARKEIWEILLKLKKKRTIILSTHHMDEADVLGDRIAIISQGKLCCCGSSLYLKSQYGNGYYLTLVQDDGKGNDKEDSDDDMDFMDSRPQSRGSVRTTVDVKPIVNKQFEIEDEGFGDNSDDKSDSGGSKPPTPPPESATMVPGFSTKRTTEFIGKYVKKAKLVEESSTELTYQLPADAAHSGQFEQLFKQLERCHKDMGISSFGISDTSLEEVFLKVAEETGVDQDDETKRKKLEEGTDSGRFAKPVTRLSFRRKKKKSFLKMLAIKGKNPKVDSEELMDDTESVISVPTSEKSIETGFSHKDHVKHTGARLKLQQFKAIFLKRFHRLRRSKKGFFFEIIMPALFILASMALAKIRPPSFGEPPLELQPWMYTPQKGAPNLYTFFSNDGNDFGVGADLTKTLLTKPWMGNRCMDPKIKQISDYSCKADSYESLWTNGGRFTGNDAIDFPQCDCSSGFQVCPSGAGGPEPPKKLLPTTDYLYNMTGRNISDWLVKTMKPFQKRRYGGFSFGDINNISLALNASRIREIFEDILYNLTQTSTNSSEFFNDLEDILEDAVTQDTVKVWYNNKGWTAIVSYMNVMNNRILRSRLSPGQNPEEFGITTVNYPMNATVKQFTEETLRESFIDVTIAICMIFAMSFIPASFVMVLIEERSSNSKHLQFVSGVNPFIYWLANFLWDMVNYMIPSILCIIIFLCFQTKSYVGPGNLEVLIVLLILYGFAMTPLMYPFTRFFSVPSTAMVVLTSVNIFLGTTSTLATFIIEFLERDDEELKNVNAILKKAFLLLPQYCLGRGLTDMSRNQLWADNSDIISPGSYEKVWKSPFEFDQVGRNLLSMFCVGILFFILNLLIEYNFFLSRSWSCFWNSKPNFKSLADEDIDVTNERKRINNKQTKEDVLIIDNLTKVYRLHGKKGRNIAVDRSCFGVPNGQCFGLLGVNGAGKTTTFKMLTGDVDVTQGNATLNGHSILKDLEKVRLDLGYCPQFDAFDPLLTGREILCFFARLRGIQEKDIKQITEWGIRKLGLIQYGDKRSGDYSGGNKRKLSTAISLIGNPSVIFMDEPTTGMDPHARRFLWNCINNIVKDGRSVVLTSHSMEECEALCNRLAIMVNGRLKCIGSTQHLKNRFGNGYTVIIRVAGEIPVLEPVKDFMANVFGDPELKEEHNNMLQYQLNSKIKLSRIFGQMEAVKVKDYSVSQTTLDQVFIHFASKQTDMLDDELSNEKGSSHRGKQLSFRNSIVPDDSDMESVTGSTADLMTHERRLNIYGSFRGETTDDESLAGSTVGLVRPNSSRSSTRSTASDQNFPNVQIF
ncbi:ATP-binding cassette, subfamily A (ABC1), member 1 [Mytilus galloprovincialis]|uniref:ATP-binding cassette, subfamily A (ABC1), member 1 n=1 Tax=Mytilus galloprovincialis TaxID=29158 RepID=A0A8B6F4B0_MYTGA|nr:ATP-binding cassette, subfamily A (ABC1), member 1 [Mytilus galloprovincialis]